MGKDEGRVTILATADVHNDKRLIERLREEAEQRGADLIILAGDIFTGFSPLEGLLKPLEGFRVALIPGNHDPHLDVELIAHAYAWYSLHGRAFKLGEVGIFGYSAVTLGPEAVDEQAIEHALQEAAERVRDARVKIMVTHVPPAGTRIEAGLPVGSHAVRRVIEAVQPDLVVTAHVHETRGLEDRIGKSRIVNVSRLIKAFHITPEGVRDA